MAISTRVHGLRACAQRAADVKRPAAAIPAGLLDRARGCFLAGAIGDAVGARSSEITANTQLALFTAEGLIRARINRSDPRAAVCRSYHRWLQTQSERCAHRGVADDLDGWLVSNPELFARRDPDPDCVTALMARHPGNLDEPLDLSSGRGALVRSAPVGFVLAADPFDLGIDLARLSHGHPIAYLAAGAFAEIVACLANGRDLRWAVDGAIDRLVARDGHAEVRGALDAAVAAAGYGPGAPLEHFGDGCRADELLGFAVYCALAFARCAPASRLERSLALAASHPRCASSAAALTGQLLGSRLGAGALDGVKLAGLELREVVDTVAIDLVTEIHRREPCPPWWRARYP